MNFLRIAFIAFALSFGAAQAQQLSVAHNPGFVDVAYFENRMDLSPNFSLQLDRDMLSIITEKAGEKTTKIQKWIEGIEFISIRAFELADNDAQDAREAMQTLKRDLDSRKWKSILRVRTEDAHVHLMFLKNESSVDGLFGVALKDNQRLAVVNVVGKFDFKDLADLTRNISAQLSSRSDGDERMTVDQSPSIFGSSSSAQNSDAQRLFNYGLECSPNPSDGQTTIRFTLPAAAEVNLGIYELNGGLIKQLVRDTHYDAGEFSIPWDGSDASGTKAPAGVYLYRLESENLILSEILVVQ